MNSYKTVNKSELNLIRIFLLVCGIITPFIFVFFKDVIQEPHIVMFFDSPYSINISQTTNITFALLTLGLWALTYYSLFVRRYISWFIFGLIFLGTNGLLFHIFNPVFSIEELFLLYIVIFFSTLIFKNIYQIISFNIYIFAFLIIKFSHLRDDEVSVNIPSIFGTLIFAGVISYLIFYSRNKSYNRMLESEKQKDLILRNFPDIILEVDNYKQIVFSNYDKIPLGDISNFFTFITPDYRSNAIKLLERSFDICFGHQITNKVTLEENFYTIMGKWIEIRIIPYRMDRTRIDRLIIHGKNITKVLEFQEKHLEKSRELEVSEQRYKNLLDGFNVGIYSTKDGLFTSVNTTVCRFLGYTEDELIGTKALDLLDPETREKVEKQINTQRDKNEFKPIKITCYTKEQEAIKLQLMLNGNDKDLISYGVLLPL